MLNALLRTFAAAVRSALRSAGLYDSLAAGFRRLSSPALPHSAPGPIDEDTLATLLAAADALAGVAIEPAHYAEFFRWRSEHLPGHRALYNRFRRTVNAAARRSCGAPFPHCPRDARARILRPAFRTRRARGRTARLRVAVLEREWWLIDRHIVRETLGLFARSDAWRVAGYEAWPATPRGLDRYRLPTAERTVPEVRA